MGDLVPRMWITGDVEKKNLRWLIRTSQGGWGKKGTERKNREAKRAGNLVAGRT